MTTRLGAKYQAKPSYSNHEMESNIEATLQKIFGLLDALDSKFDSLEEELEP